MSAVWLASLFAGGEHCADGVGVVVELGSACPDWSKVFVVTVDAWTGASIAVGGQRQRWSQNLESLDRYRPQMASSMIDSYTSSAVRSDVT